MCGLTAPQSDHSANQVLSKPKLLSQRNRGESIGYTCELCCARTVQGRIPWKAQRLWQNSTAVKRGIRVLQQSSELQAGSVAQEAAKACCLSSLTLCQRRGCPGSTPLFSEQQLVVAHSTLKLPVHRLCRNKCQSRALPVPLHFHCRLQTADCVSLFQSCVWWFKISKGF